MSTDGLISPSRLALFSRSPVIGAWWEELHSIDPDRAPRPQVQALDELLFDAGLKHEKVLIGKLKAAKRTIAELPGKQSESDYAATVEAMRSGVDYIWQASLRNAEMRGAADLLERIEEPSSLGSWSYIPIECKLSSHPRPIYLVQACAYCELLEPVLGMRPERLKLYLGGDHFKEYATREFWSWYEHLRERYRNFRSSFDATQEPEDAPGDHGRWEPFIQQRLEAKRDLVLVANMRQSQRNKLNATGILTIDELAAWPEGEAVAGLDSAVLSRLRDQARIQVATETQCNHTRPAYTVLPVEQQRRGLAMLPSPDAGDIWFDMEGFPDPTNGEKLEYLFGACYRSKQGELRFKPWWAHSASEEKQVFDEFVQWVQQRRQQYPDLHVYHYASYEKTALGKLASRHQIHQVQIDQWLRDELLVDLFPIVRNGLLIGTPSYSIKKVERLYGEPRKEDVDSAADSMVQYAQWRKSGDQKILDNIRAYNEKDCQVTEGLHHFLLHLPQMRQIPFRDNKWEAAALDDNQDKQHTVYEKELEVAARQWLQELPAQNSKQHAQSPRGLNRQLHQLIGQLIDFQEREGKVEWWEFFNRMQLTPEEREDDSEVIAGAHLQVVERSTKQSDDYCYRFDASQPLKLSAKGNTKLRFALLPLAQHGERLLPLSPLLNEKKKALDLEGVLDEEQADLVKLKVSHKLLAQLTKAGFTDGSLPSHADLVPLPKQIYKHMLKHLVRRAQHWVLKRKPLSQALLHLLQRRSIPALPDLNQRIRSAPERTATELASLMTHAHGVGLSLQGPPGTGKTTVTAALIAQLVHAGQRVAVSSTTNEAINNLLVKTQSCLEEQGSTALVAKVSSSTGYKADVASLGSSKVQAFKKADIPQDSPVLGATIFTLVEEQYDDAPFDLLVIDEAGQVALSNLLYLSCVARNIVLVGDQQQLSQPNRAAHPGDSGRSCLDYVMDNAPVVAPDQGVFLATSWRMPPTLTQLVSELFYDGKLQPAQHNNANRVFWDGPQQGLMFDPVLHRGNSTSSHEEVKYIAQLVERLHGKLYQRARLVKGKLKLSDAVLGSQDILITAPYNMQVNYLKRYLGHKARVGTVDKFQGQEAPVAIHSLTASDADSAPRGIDFLLEPNRLNVAISRAQCLSIVVGSPQLATGISNSIQSVQRLNRLCRLMATHSF